MIAEHPSHGGPPDPDDRVPIKAVVILALAFGAAVLAASKPAAAVGLMAFAAIAGLLWIILR
jgi:hypothetical protein